jgi:hypothetical protein
MNLRNERLPNTACSRWAATGVELVKKLTLKAKTSKGSKVFVDIIDQVYKTSRKVADDFKKNMRIVLMTLFQPGMIGSLSQSTNDFIHKKTKEKRL